MAGLHAQLAPVSSPPKARTGLRDIARGGALNLAGALVSAVTTIGVTLIITRHFSKPVAGAFFAATSVFIIVSAVAGLGSSNGVVYFVARLRSLDDRGRIPAMLRAAFRPAACVAVLSAVLVAVAARPLAWGLLGGHARPGVSIQSVAEALRAMAIALPFAALLDTFLGVARGYRDMRPTVIIDRLGRSSGQLIGVIIAVATGGAALLAPLWAAAYVPATIAAWLWLRHIRRREGLGKGPDVSQAQAGGRASTRRAAARAPREFWRFTAPRSLATMAQIVIQRLDIVLVGIMRGPAEAAIYTAATRFLIVGQLGNAAISLAAQPRFTELFAVGASREANRIYQVTTGWLITVTWPIYLLAIVYGSQILTVFGHSYRAGTPVMIILAASMLVATASGQVDMVLTTTGRSSWSLANGATALAVNVSLDLILIPRYGITGAAIGWAAAIGVTNLVPLSQVAVVARLHPFGRGTLAACCIATISFCVIPIGFRALTSDHAAGAIAAVGAGCLVYAAGLWILRDALQLPGISGQGTHRRKPAFRRRPSGPTIGVPPDGRP